MLLYLLAAAALFAQSPASSRASALLDAGIELSNRGQFPAAASKFVEALALDPSLAEAHYLLGLIRQQDGRPDAALRSFQSALAIHPAYPAAQARVCELETAFAAARESGYAKAETACRRALRLDPKDPEPHFHLGWSLAKLSKRTEAIQEFKQALALNPKLPKVKFELAMAYADSQNFTLARPLLEEVVRTEPANTNARFQLGSLLVKQNDCAAAIPLLATATESAQTHYLMAGCLKKLNRESEAAAEFEKVKAAREGADARMQAKYRAAVAHQKAEAGDLAQAITEYRAALALAPDPSVAIDLAIVLLKSGRDAEVLPLLKDSTDPVARYQYALALTKLGRLDEARAALAQALRDKPAFVEAWYHQGVVAMTQNRPAEAEPSFRAAVELRPDEPALRQAWAQSLEKCGRSSEAAAQRALASRGPK